MPVKNRADQRLLLRKLNDALDRLLLADSVEKLEIVVTQKIARIRVQAEMLNDSRS